jgi:hypothetical protein
MPKRGAANSTAVRGNFKGADVWLPRGLLKFFWGCDVQEQKIAQNIETKTKRFRISDRRRKKKPEVWPQKKGPAMGLEPTWVV